MNNGRRPKGLWAALLLLSFILIGLAGCTRQGPAVGQTPDRPTDELAALVASGGQGSSTGVNCPGLGYGQATIRESYLSALGQPCRKVLFVDQFGSRHDLAVCAEGQGRWATAPDIFRSAGRP